MKSSIQGFHMPRYQDIPNMGLYLEQTTKYLNHFLAPLGCMEVTSSMISNYVKKGLIDNPVKKQYGRQQIAYLIFIAIAKNVLSLDALVNFIAVQKRTYPLEKAYDYFCDQLESTLFFTAEVNDTMDIVGEDTADEKRLLFSCIVAVTQKIYLEKCLDAIAAEGTDK
jgi:hypothetical protein